VGREPNKRDAKRRRRFDWLVLVALTLATASVTAALPHILPIFTAAEEWVTDLRIAHLTPAQASNEDIIILAITDDTLSALPYRSPVDRGFLAELVNILRAREVRAIGLDILFDRPTEPAKDARLRDALAAVNQPLVVAWADERLDVSAGDQEYLAEFTGTARRGYAALTKDAIDGSVRQHRPRWESENGAVLSLPAALADALGATVPEEPFRIDFRGRPDAATPAFSIYPAHAASVLPADWLKDKIVLVGADIPHADRHRTPLAARDGVGEIAGVLVHAHILSQLLEGREPPRLSTALAWLFAFAMAGVGLVLALLPRIPLLVKGGLAALFLFGIWVGGFALFAEGGPIVPLLAPSLGFVLASSLATAFASRRHRAQRQQIRKMFQHFLAPQMVKRLENDPEQLRPGGERREMTFIFTDMAGFTSFSESLEPAVLVSLLNDYLDGMSRIVLRHHGTIDKFVGDAVVAFFGAPEEQPEHASLAVTCALNMDAFVQGFIRQWEERGVQLGITRIGVHTGEATVGNFGGSERFDYTAMGDTVNTAARLEGVNKYLGTRICVSGETVKRCHDVAFRPVGDLVLKGKKIAVPAFEPLRPGAENSPAVAAYNAAFDLLRNDDAKAAGAFTTLLESVPDDALVRLHLERQKRGEKGVRIVMEEK
jgi:class 3 adenylate cyclase